MREPIRARFARLCPMRTIWPWLCVLTACGGGAGDPLGGTPDGPVTTAPDAATPDAATPDAWSLALDVRTVHVSGVITANGQIPAQSCTGAESRGQVILSEAAGHATFHLPIPCAGATEPFTFSGDVYPGVYRVQVAGDRSSLPSMSLTVEDALELRADRDGLAYDVHSHTVGGTLTQNGHLPAQSCQPGLERAQVHFHEKSRGYFFSLPVPCDDDGTPFTFTGSVAPGTYEVSVAGVNSSLPQSMHVVQTGLVIDSDRGDLAYDLVTHAVSGTVTLNGAVPGQDATCRTQRGQVTFSSATAGSFTLRIPCAPAGTPFTFAGELYPGSYRVEVSGTGSELPRDRFRAAEALVVAARPPGSPSTSRPSRCRAP